MRFRLIFRYKGVQCNTLFLRSACCRTPQAPIVASMSSDFAGSFQPQAPNVVPIPPGFAGFFRAQAPYVAPIPFCFAGISQSQASIAAPVRRFTYRQRDTNLPAMLPKGRAWPVSGRPLWTSDNVVRGSCRGILTPPCCSRARTAHRQRRLSLGGANSRLLHIGPAERRQRRQEGVMSQVST